MKIKDYDKENDILFIHWGDMTKYSMELFDGQIILDFDKKDNPVGIEIMDFMEQVKKHDKKFKKILKDNGKP